MIEGLERALAVVQEVFADATARGASIDVGELAGVVLAAQRVVNAASAVQAVGLAGIASRDEVRAGDGSWVAVDRGAGFVSEFAGVTVAPMLGLTSRGAEERVRTAAGLVSRLPGVLAAMGAGELDGWRASIVVAETAETTAEACARVEAMVLPRICSETGGRVRARVRRALARVDADAVRVRAAKARLERSVRVFPSHVVGLSEWVAVLPAHESALCKAAVEDHACALRAEDPDLSADQARADALVDLVLARASVTTTVHLTMPVETLTVDAPADRQVLDEEGVVVGPSWQQVCAMGYEIPASGSSPGTWWPGSVSGSTPGSAGCCSTRPRGPRWRPVVPGTPRRRRCAGSSPTGTGPAGPRAVSRRRGSATWTTSSPGRWAGPSGRTCSPCAGAITG
jgi:hypothetical protein